MFYYKLLTFFIVVLLLPLILFSYVSQAYAASWWNSNWSFKKQITFNNSAQAENLTNFPVLVKLTSSNFDFAKSQSNGQDIRFVDGDDATSLNYEIEKWDQANRQAFIWVKVPQIDASSSTDSIYMYYGNNTAGDAQSVNSVWDSNFRFVSHLKETNGYVTDSTSNGNNSTTNYRVGATNAAGTTPTSISSGQVDGAQSFNGTSNYYTFDDNDSLDITDSVTVSAWINLPASLSTMTDASGIIHKATAGVPDNNDNYGLITGVNGAWGDSFIWLVGRAAGEIAAVVQYSPPLNTWVNLTGTYNKSTGALKVFVNGVDHALFIDQSAIITPRASTGPLQIGKTWDITTGFFKGSIDEVRISGVVRSPNWIAAEYKSGTDTFNSFSSEQSGTGPTLTLSSNTGSGNAGKTRITGNMSSGNSGFNITNVECSVNGGGFSSATPTDGSYNSQNEDFYCDFNQNDNSYSGNGFSVRARGYLGGGPIVDNVMYFTPFSLSKVTNNTSAPTVFFSVINQPKVLTDNISKYQIQAKWGDINSKAPWLTVLDNIPISGILDNTNQLSVTTDQFKATYSNVDGGPGSNITKDTNITVTPKIPILTGNNGDSYTLRVIALDKSGHSIESNTQTIKVPPSPLPFKAITPGFPLAILNISGYGDPKLSTLSPNLTKSVYNINSTNPIFYGIAFANSNITLQLTEGANTKTYITIANSQSRFGINIPKGDLVAGKTYSAILSATLNSQYTQLPFSLTIY